MTIPEVLDLPANMDETPVLEVLDNHVILAVLHQVCVFCYCRVASTFPLRRWSWRIVYSRV